MVGSALVSRAIMIGADWDEERKEENEFEEDRENNGGSKAHLNRMSETLLDGEGENLHGDVLSFLMQSGVEDPKKVSLDDRGADATRTKSKGSRTSAQRRREEERTKEAGLTSTRRSCRCRR